MSTKPNEIILTRNVFENDKEIKEFAGNVSSLLDEIINFSTVIFNDSIQVMLH